MSKKKLWIILGVVALVVLIVAVSALKSERLRIGPNDRVCALVCGAGADGI